MKSMSPPTTPQPPPSNTRIKFNIKGPLLSSIDRLSFLSTLHKSLEDPSYHLTIISESKVLEDYGSGVGYRNQFGLAVGKSEVARKYISKYGQSYKNFVWLNADSEQSLQSSFLIIAQEYLQLNPLQYSKSPGKFMMMIFDLLFPTLHTTTLPSLLVFDNCENYKVLQKFLPHTHAHPSIRVLILENSRTHRDEDWTLHSGQVLQLKTFSTEESVKFILKSLQLSQTDPQNKSDALDLADLLSGLPLALSQAISYIRRKNNKKTSGNGPLTKISRKFTLRDYTKKFLTTKMTLSDPLSPCSCGETDTIFRTCLNMNLSKVVKSSKIIHTLSLLHDDLIDSRLLLLLLDPQNLDNVTLHKHLHLLDNYGIIKIHHPDPKLNNNNMTSSICISIHRLTQEIIIQKLEETPTRLQDLIDDLTSQSLQILDNLDTIQVDLLPSFLTNMLTLSSNIKSNPSKAQLLFKVNLASKLKTLGRYESSLHLYQEIWSFIKAQMGPSHQMTLTAESQIANLLYVKGDLPQALGHYTKIYERQRENCRNHEFPSLIDCMRHIARILTDTGDTQGALEMYREIVQVKKRFLGPTHPDILKFVQKIAQMLMEDGDGRNLEEALEWYEEALDITRETLREDHPQTLKIMEDKAGVLKKIGRLEEAREMYEKIFDAKKKSLGKCHVDTIKSQCCLGQVLREQRKLRDAQKVFEEAIEVGRKGMGDNHEDVLGIQNCIGEILKEQGKIKEALILFQDVLGRSEKGQGCRAKSLENLNRIGGTGRRFDWVAQREYFI